MTNARKLTHTAILIAIAICFQLLYLIGGFNMLPVAIYIVGSLVNLILFIAISRVGLWALLVAIITPIISLFVGHQSFPILIPIVMIGNCIIPITWWLLHDKLKLVSEFITVIIASVIKAGFLWLVAPSVVKVFVLPAFNTAKAETVYATISASMSIPQLVTALIGGVVAVIVLRLLPKATT